MPKSNSNPTPQIWTHNSYPHLRSKPTIATPQIWWSTLCSSWRRKEEASVWEVRKKKRKRKKKKERKKERRKLWREISKSEEERKQRQKKEREKGDVGWCQELSVTIQCNGSHNFPLFTKLPFNSYLKNLKTPKMCFHFSSLILNILSIEWWELNYENQAKQHFLWWGPQFLSDEWWKLGYEWWKQVNQIGT